MTLSRQALFHAWALKKLDVEFSRNRASGLSAGALQQVEQMRQDHRRQISTVSQRLVGMLSAMAVDAISASPGQKTSQDSARLLKLVMEQYDLARGLFTSSAQASRSATADLARLLALLQQTN